MVTEAPRNVVTARIGSDLQKPLLDLQNKQICNILDNVQKIKIASNGCML